MAQTSMLARMVALVGDAAIAWRRMQGPMPEQAVGATPNIPEAKPQAIRGRCVSASRGKDS